MIPRGSFWPEEKQDLADSDLSAQHPYRRTWHNEEAGANEGRHRVQSREEVRRPKCGREEFRFKSRSPILVVLDGVSRAHNIGAIFRVCDSILVEGPVICGIEGDPRKRKLVQQRWVPWLGRSMHDVHNLVHEVDQKSAFLRILEPAIWTDGPMGKMVLWCWDGGEKNELGFIKARQRGGIELAKSKGDDYKRRKSTIDRSTVDD